MDMEMQFQKGDFQSYRATVKFHLGSEELDVWEGTEVEFDGFTLKIGNDSYNIPTVRAAIKKQWLVPIADQTSKYRPQPAGVKVHAAQTEGRERGDEIQMMAVSDEETVVTSVADANVGQKMGKVIFEEDQDARPVAKISTPAKQNTKVTDSRTAAAEARKLDSSVPKKAQPLQQAVSGEELSELLPDAAVASPPPRAAKPKKTYYKPVQHELRTLRGSKGEFQWDLNHHWKTRVKLAVENFAGDMKAIAAIKSVEMDSVKKRIDNALA
jgi:hypothetical protein